MTVKIFSCIVHAYKQFEDRVDADVMTFLCHAADEESAEVMAMLAAERNFSNKINKGYQIETQLQRVDVQKLNQLLKGEIQTVFPYNDSVLNDDFLT